MTDQATILFRPAGPDDAEAIAAMFTDEGYPAGPSDIIARLERFDTPEARVIVAEHEGALLGFIVIHALPRFEHDDLPPGARHGDGRDESVRAGAHHHRIDVAHTHHPTLSETPSTVVIDSNFS